MRFLFNYIVPLVLLMGLWACVDLNFDEPPVTGLPDITPNTSISELKALHTVGQEDQRIDSDIVIGGVVIADDQSGNLRQRIILQDETGGIVLRLKSVGLYNNFPIGRQIFVRAQDLYIGDEGGVIELNGSPERPIEEPLIEAHVFAGARDQVLIPDTVAIEALAEEHISTLVHLRGVQFIPNDTSQVFSDIFARQAKDRVLTDCEENRIVLRTGGYAEFGDARTPAGRGGITAVYSVTTKTSKLLIRELADIDFPMARCTVDGGGGELDPVLLSIRDLRDSFALGMTLIPQGLRIKGVVTSNRADGNIEPSLVVIQDGRAGILLRFAQDHGYRPGDELEIDISGLQLSEFRGQLQITELLTTDVVLLGSAPLPAPRLITIEEITDNLETWESMLVRVERVELSVNFGWEGSVGATDPTGTIAHITLPTASFAKEALPEAPVDLVAIVWEADAPQLRIRNLEDVTVLDIGGGGDLTELDEPFTSQEPDTEIELDGWTNLAVKGTRRWEAKEFSGNVYAQATAYNDENADMETWLITPPILLEDDRLLSFRSAQAFFQHDGLSVWISKDFNGSNFNVSTWTQLSSARIANVNSGQNQWVDSGDLDLSEFEGTIYIGFRYVGSAASNTTTYRIDDVRIRKP